MIFRRACAAEIEKIIVLQSDIFHMEQEIHMTARDTTVKIVCDMGGEITGESYPFYGGNVTPVVLKKENFR